MPRPALSRLVAPIAAIRLAARFALPLELAGMLAAVALGATV
jgi:hypothetical protein